jgi:uncharacterized protein YndB with AHSA1/START domain
MIPKDVVVHVNKQFHTTADRVFDAWTIPKLVKHWLFADKDSSIMRADIDARIGGRFSVLEKSNEVSIEHSGKYVEMERPGHLAFSLESPQHFTGVTYVSIFIRPKRHGCELSLTQTGVSPDKTEANWYRMLQRLETVLNEKPARQSAKPVTPEHN